jgi:hypothetical protein
MPLGGEPERVSVDAVMAEVQGRVRERLRERMLAAGGSTAFADPSVFAEVEALLDKATEVQETSPLLLPELLGDRDTWRLATKMDYRSHRGAGAASVIAFLKQRVLMPPFRWLFEYSRDNFERQRRTNLVLFACVQELALETVRLRREIDRRSPSPQDSRPVGRT